VPFVSFYREADELFTFREHPRVKRIKTECARLFLRNLQLGLHVIDASWCHATNRSAFLVVITCACREKTFNLLEIPLSPGTFRHLKHGSHSNLKLLDVRDDETPQSNPRLRLSRWTKFVSGGSSQKITNSLTETLLPWVILSSFGSSAGDEGCWSKDGFWKTKIDSRAPGVSPLGLSHRNLGNWRHSFIFGIRKAWFRIPPTLVT
jgi:hypothetical protein